MRLMSFLLIGVLCVGCSPSDSSDSTETSAVPAGENTSDNMASTTEAPDAITVSFNPGESATLAVPEMSCPFACYPKVKETLEGIDGITGVELVPQKEDGVIDDRRVTLTFGGSVDGARAVAALDQAGFPGAKFE